MYKITSLKDYHPGGLDAFTQSMRRRKHAASVAGLAADQPIVKAEINAGRWIARCPFCPGAELVDPDDPRFFCLSCDNEQAGGRWLQVAIPAQPKAIEAELLKRPAQSNRNWLPGESVAKLKRENKEHGVVS